MKNKGILVLVLLLSSIAFSQTVSRTYGPEEVKRVGNEIWFIKNIQEDSLVCSGTIRDQCIINTSFSRPVTRVIADPSISLGEAKQSRYGDFVSRSNPRMDKITHRFLGFVSYYPVEQRIIHYDRKNHTMTARQEMGPVDWRINILSMYAVVILGVMVVLWTMGEITRYSHQKIPRVGITTLLCMHTACMLWISEVRPYATEPIMCIMGLVFFTAICIFTAAMIFRNNPIERGPLWWQLFYLGLVTVGLMGIILDIFRWQSNMMYGFGWIGCALGAVVVLRGFSRCNTWWRGLRIRSIMGVG